jgi:hypothetical protein
VSKGAQVKPASNPRRDEGYRTLAATAAETSESGVRQTRKFCVRQ